MAYRIGNRSTLPLSVDLSDGTVVHIGPGKTSPPLREERLYFNCHLAKWEQEGIAIRMPAHMHEVRACEGGASDVASAAALATSAPKRATPVHHGKSHGKDKKRGR
jgi:hypothetical protein